MKKLVLVGLIASLLMPVSAQAAETKFVGGPLTNLESQGATINITLSNVPAKGGLYIQQCVEAPAGTRPAGVVRRVRRRAPAAAAPGWPIPRRAAPRAG